MEKMTVGKAQEILKKYEMYKAFPFYAQPCEANDAIHACYFMEGFSAQEVKCVNEHANAQRIIDWINDPNRKPAITAFTEGPERQIAYAVERLKESR